MYDFWHRKQSLNFKDSSLPTKSVVDSWTARNQIEYDMIDLTTDKIPPGQQPVSRNKWPIIGEKQPKSSDAPWQLSLSGLVENEFALTPNQLGELPQTQLKMDIHCVTRWSRQVVEFEGVLLSDLLEKAKVGPNANFVSFVSRSERNHSTSLPLQVACELNTLIALKVDGEPLTKEHGGPIRNIVPNRYFYKSVKWLERIEIIAEDRLGYWEAETGYHNNADPWQEERYMAPAIDRRTALKLIESRDFSGQDLRSIDASNRDLSKLAATGAFLRDANFRKSNLSSADFTDANMSNAHLENANLQGVNFTRTDLEGANLSGADIRGANFTNCSLIGASFCEQLSDGSRLQAVLDETTILPPDILEPLTREQLDFLASIAEQ